VNDVSQAVDADPAAAVPDAADPELSIFQEVLQAVLGDAEIKGKLDGHPDRAEALREYLWDGRDVLALYVSAERKRWTDAAGRAADPLEAVKAEKKIEKTWPYRFVQTPAALLGLLALGSVIVFLLISKWHAEAWWWEGLLSSVVVFVVMMAVAIAVGTVNESSVTARESETYHDVARQARSEYSDVLRNTMLGEARAWINAKQPEPIDPSRLTIKRAPGLAEIFNREYMISSAADKQLADLIDQLSAGGTIGLAGPRGAGKTSLIRKYSPEETAVSPATDAISLLVSAPVEYQPADFVLHLLYLLAGAYLELCEKPGDSGRHAPVPLIPLPDRRPARARKQQPERAAQPDNGKRDQLINDAKRFRQQIRAQQSYTTTVGASLSAPASIVSASGQAAATATDLPWNYPELVSTFCSFLRNVARDLHERYEKKNPGGAGTAAGPWELRGCVLIGIDEIDKISDAKQAQRFVNELKVMLGVPYCYYLVAVSDDALAAYEMRGLPVRDAFDSAFDEILHVRYFCLGDSRELLSKRVIDLHEPFVRLCHCLSGGLPRDLIRVARHAVILAGRYRDLQADRLEAVCQQLVLEDLRRKLDVGVGNWAGHRLGQADSRLLHSIQQVVAFQPSDEDRRKESDLRTGRQLRTELGKIATSLVPANSHQENTVVSGFAVYVYYLLTLLDVFAPELSAKGQIVDAAGEPVPDAAFDQLCGIRQSLGAEPQWTWLTISAFRQARGL
jgi:hypothetical protein